MTQKLIKEHEEIVEGETIWIEDEVIDNFTQTGTVVLNPEDQTLMIDIPLVDYSGTPARWLSSNGNDGVC